MDAILAQKDGLSTLVNDQRETDKNNKGKEAKYYHIRSRFFRQIKHIMQELGMSDEKLNWETWYHDTKEWNQKIVWSNLYNIAPRNGGNPESGFIKQGMPQYVEMLKLQIEEFKPDIVICCPLSGWFVHRKRNGWKYSCDCL